MTKSRYSLLFVLGLTACAATALAADNSSDNSQNTMKKENQMESKSSSAVDTSSAKSPKDVCKNIVEAAKRDDFKSIQMWTWGWDHKGWNQSAGESAEQSSGKMNKSKGAESAFHKMHQNHMSELKDLSCGSENIAGTHAFVEAESKGEKRLIPFVQQNGQWKFDAHTYMSFYRDAAKSMKKMES